ncbi:Tn3 family transposase [Lysinibacillus fusiformis]|nr:Tn3 family transposase [Lysinibacillus fusiformis]
MTSELFFIAVINERKIEHSIAVIQNICRRSHLVTATLISPQNTVSVYLSEATKHLKQKESLQENLLNRILPLGWEHINFLGDW